MKTEAKGMFGTIGEDETPAVSVGVAGGVLEARTIQRSPDDDEYFGSAPGYSAAGNAVSLSDTPTNGAFTALHPVFRWAQEEAGLYDYVNGSIPANMSYIPAFSRDRDTVIVVRDAGKGGLRPFVVTELAPPAQPIPVIVPFGWSPTTTLSTDTLTVMNVPAATQAVLGSASYLPTLLQQYLVPGEDPASPFDGLWLFGEGTSGILQNVPGPRCRIALSVIAASIGNAKWTYAVQKSPGGLGPWTTVSTLVEYDLNALGAIESWTFSGFGEFVIDPGDALRVVVFHDNAGVQQTTIKNAKVVINTVSVRP